MLSPLASKLSVSPHAGNAASRPNGGTRAGADRDSTGGPGQFDEALTCALQDTSNSDTKARAADLPTSAKQSLAVKPTPERPAGREIKDDARAVVAVASLATTLSTSMLKLVPTVLRKDISDGSSMIPVGKKPEKDREAQQAEEKEPLPSPEMTGTTVPELGVAMQAIPVNAPPPVIGKSASFASRDGGAVEPVLLTAPQSAVPSEDITIVRPDKSEPKETEAFSLKLERRAAAPSSGSAAVGSPDKESKNGPETASEPSGPPRLSQSNKAGNPPVTSNSSAAIPMAERSASAKFSGGNGEAEQRGKDEAPLPKPASGDARESKQAFPDYSSSPAPFVKDTGAPEQSRNVQALMQPVVVENQNAATGAAKEVAIRLQNESGETINVKLVDQGGQVQVTVRSSDPSAAASLREDLSSLTSSLEKVGWKSEVSLPVATSFEPVNQTQHADRESQDTPGQRQTDWQQETPKKRPSSTDAWDEMLTNQTV